MSGAVTIINTPSTGSNGSNAGPAFNSASGGDAGSATDAGASFSNQNFSAVVGDLDLTPSATGGLGGGGTRGAAGANGTSQTVGNDTTTQAGSPGGAGGGGGAGGDATIAMSDDSAGTTATPFAGSFYLDAVAVAGGGGTSNTAGNGGSGGQNEDVDLPGLTPILAQGNSGGAGGTAQAAGAGGSANSDITGLSSAIAYSTTLNVTAFGGNGGTNGSTFSGGSGGGGGAASNGGEGSTGGAGGAALATLADTTSLGQYGIAVAVTAEGGTGGNGGMGGDGGPAITITDTTSQDNTLWVFGPNGAGGAGGAGGDATASFTGNTLTSFTVNVDIQANGGDGGLGAAGGSNLSGTINGITYQAAPPGTAGALGALGTGQIVFTGNTLTVGTGLPGDSAHNSGNRLTLQLSIEGFTAPGGSAVAIPLDGAAGGNLVFSGNDFVGTGASELDLALNGPSAAIVNTANSTIGIDGSPANPMTGFTSFDLDDGDSFVAGTGTYTVTFAPDPDTLVFLPNSGNVTLNGVTSGNLLLDFSGFGAGLDAQAVQAATTTSAGSTFIAIPGAGTIDLAGYTGPIPAGDVSFAIACYAAGTRIATPDGPVPVEHLRAGQLVLSHFGGAVAVQWIGHRRIDCRRHPRPQSVWPIRVAPDAFAPGVPNRPLYLSPDHAVFLDDALIPIRCLVNGVTIAPRELPEITYYHVELPAHDVLLAEGLPAESYLDTGNRADFENGGVAQTLHPDFGANVWQTEACAPLLQDGAEVIAAQSVLAERARQPAPARRRA